MKKIEGRERCSVSGIERKAHGQIDEWLTQTWKSFSEKWKLFS